jgi:hypothetical protein
MIKTIAGIGSRETPPNILDEMTKIGRWCKLNNVLLRSGHAEGADYAFELGAQEQCIAYIPWKGFNDKLKSKAKLYVPTFTDDLMKSVVKFHPTPEKLSFGVQKIMARNACQILGRDMKDHSQAVVCWTKDGKDTGGTGQALRIAAHYKVPILNMQRPEFATAIQVIAELCNIK